jgi:hypothetical protein
MKLSPYQARILRLMEEQDLVITHWRRFPGELRAKGKVDYETRCRIDRSIRESIKRNKVLRTTIEILLKAELISGWLDDWRSSYRLTDKGREAILHLSPEDFISPASKNTSLSDVISVAFIEDALQVRHPADKGWLMFREITFWGGRRIDVLFLNRWWSQNHKLIAYEIKRGRGDFLNEIKHPEKRKPVIMHVDQFFFAAPKGLIKPAEVPKGTGLVEVSPEGLVRIKKRAPQLMKRPDPTWYLLGTLLNNLITTYEDRLDKATGLPKKDW